MNSWVTSSWRDFLLLGLWRSSWPVLWLHEHSQLGSQTTSMLAWHAAWLRKSKAWLACLPRTRLVTQPWEWKSLVFFFKHGSPAWVWGLSSSTATLLTVAPGPLRSSSWSLPWRWRTPMLFSWTEGITKCWRPIWSTALQEKQEPSTTWISSTSSLSPSEIFLCFTWSTMKSWWCMPVSQVPGLVCGCQVRRMIQRMPSRWTPEPRPWQKLPQWIDTPNSHPTATKRPWTVLHERKKNGRQILEWSSTSCGQIPEVELDMVHPTERAEVFSCLAQMSPRSSAGRTTSVWWFDLMRWKLRDGWRITTLWWVSSALQIIWTPEATRAPSSHWLRAQMASSRPDDVYI